MIQHPTKFHLGTESQFSAIPWKENVCNITEVIFRASSPFCINLSLYETLFQEGGIVCIRCCPLPFVGTEVFLLSFNLHDKKYFSCLTNT